MNQPRNGSIARKLMFRVHAPNRVDAILRSQNPVRIAINAETIMLQLTDTATRMSRFSAGPPSRKASDECRLDEQYEEMGAEGNRRDCDDSRDFAAGELKDAIQEAGVCDGVVDRAEQFGAAAYRDHLPRRDGSDEAANHGRLEDSPPEEEDHLVENREQDVEGHVRTLGRPDERSPVGREAEHIGECRGGNDPREEFAPERGSSGCHRDAR